MTTTSATSGGSSQSPVPQPSSSSSNTSDTSSSTMSEKKLRPGSQGKMTNVPIDTSQDASVDSTKDTRNTDEILRYQRSASRTQTMTIKNNTQQAALDNASEKQPSLDAYSGDAKPLPLSDESVNLIAEFQFGPQSKSIVGGMDFLPGEDLDPSLYSDYDDSNPPPTDISITPDTTSSTDQPTVSPNKYTSSLGGFMVATSKGLLEMITENTAFKTTASQIQAKNMQMSFSQATLSKDMGLSAATLQMTSKIISGLATVSAGAISVGGGLMSWGVNDLSATAKGEKKAITDAQGELKTAEQALQANKTNIPIKEQEIETLKKNSELTDDGDLTDLGIRTKEDAKAALPKKEAELKTKEDLIADKQDELNKLGMGRTGTASARMTKQEVELQREVDNLTKEKNDLQEEINGLNETIGKTDLDAGRQAKIDAGTKLPQEEAKLKSMKDDMPKLEKNVSDKEKTYNEMVSSRANKISSYDGKATMFTRGLGEMISGAGNVASGIVELYAAQQNTMADYAKSMKSINDTMSQTMAKSIQTAEDTISGVFQTLMQVTKTKNTQG